MSESNIIISVADEIRKTLIHVVALYNQGIQEANRLDDKKSREAFEMSYNLLVGRRPGEFINPVYDDLDQSTDHLPKV